jgi:hypothetical protein
LTSTGRLNADEVILRRSIELRRSEVSRMPKHDPNRAGIINRVADRVLIGQLNEVSGHDALV